MNELKQALQQAVDALKSCSPYIATQAVGCHGDKCRELWCYSCNGEDEAHIEAGNGMNSYQLVCAAIAAAESTLAQPEPQFDQLAAVTADRDSWMQQASDRLDDAVRFGAERDQLRAEVTLLTHKLLCCGVAARNPDPTLTTRGEYAGAWDSAQAQMVRELRAEVERLRADRVPLTVAKIREIEAWFANVFGMESQVTEEFARAVERAHGISAEATPI